MQVKVVKVKKSDKGDFYKRQMAWELRDLTEVDAKDATKVRGHMRNVININSDMKERSVIKYLLVKYYIRCMIYLYCPGLRFPKAL